MEMDEDKLQDIRSLSSETVRLNVAALSEGWQLGKKVVEGPVNVQGENVHIL